MSELTRRWVDAMRLGRFDLAWRLAEQALASRDPGTRDDPSLPYDLRWLWDGTCFDAKHVLVRCYHGLGDTLQFARYLPRLAERAASVTVEAQERLCGLLAGLPGIDRLTAFDPASPLPRAECEMEIGEIAFALREPPSQVEPPYLHAAPAALPAGTIGICYSSGDWDPERSVPAALFRSLCGAGPCITLVPERTALPVLNPEGCPYDMAATASMVAAADLIITVDTMIAHLAGAMGRPTWLLLKADADWRWPAAGKASPWYPSMRLFAQPRPGDWCAVLAQVERALAHREMPASERRACG
ncbi:MAG: hypothetical protein JWN69_1502 [Alphaproteobacteria bacterium]|nr:hypothetical protein [Alphaproteobacteria bacterium]